MQQVKKNVWNIFLKKICIWEFPLTTLAKSVEIELTLNR